MYKMGGTLTGHYGTSYSLLCCPCWVICSAVLESSFLSVQYLMLGILCNRESELLAIHRVSQVTSEVKPTNASNKVECPVLANFVRGLP